MVFWIFIGLVIAQRLIEMRIAKRNEKWILSQGGYEVGHGHYKYIVLMHVLFFGSLIAEVVYGEKELSVLYPILFFLFALTQLGRVWALHSLGMYWNTKIMILQGSQVQSKGPYKYVKHPNYIIVALEFILIPMLFQAYFTGMLFSILNFVMMSIRIPVEERALSVHEEYQQIGITRSRIIPNVLKPIKKD
ncbi:isoprenylcysteine carboxylmethyltransferase family protein [Fredinandcohnia sp. QZ13]|uniref:isoprenylcysteine carboxyl methyltransferase family protein n=1 Tax=Fredinandcohnia sp. QZ13 TaxID=3073144 RepID=UPI0028535653|nr:isoprenylcysteine carboxylmethyltransferase family protein [Fredinandcohnia sp. QZ13]MDR4888642.1 isoprenylcysteine carboxylmethyltransferase family protein [Fredinandcohnia sp. QZ13]